MAKPDGYIDAAAGGLAFDGVNTRYLDIGFRLPVQPTAWEDELGLQRYRVTTWRQLTLGAGTDTTEIWNGWPSSSSADAVAGAQAAAWIQYDADGQDPAKPVGSALSEPSFTSSTSEPRSATFASANEAHLSFEVGAHEEGEILAIYVETESDNAFSTSDPSSTRDYETMGRNTGVYAPYQKNESFSAWLAQRQLAQNLNKILYQTRQAWTVPL